MKIAHSTTSTDMPTIYAFPRSRIAYNESLYAAMERHGERVLPGIFAFRWQLAAFKRGDVMHLHWPSFDYHDRRVVGSCVGFMRWLAILLTARIRGVRLFWTAHNIYPHERSPVPILDVWARRIVIGLSEKIFIHGAEAAKKLIVHFPAAKAKLVFIPHGHWIGRYAATISRDEARRQLGVCDDRCLFMFIGSCKPYKNIEALIDAFREVPGDAALCIAGRFSDGAYAERIRSLAAQDSRITVRDGFLPDDVLGAHLLACDAIVAPYRETLTSGTAMLAISSGRPIVSLATGHLLDVIDGQSGVLYDIAVEHSLTAALEEARSRAFDEDSILRRASQFTFDEAARITWAAFRNGPKPDA